MMTTMPRALAALVAAMLVGAVAGPGTAVAGKQKQKKKQPAKVERQVEGTYVAPAIGHLEAGCGETQSVGCVTFPIEPDERYVSVEVQDASGQPVYVMVTQGPPLLPAGHGGEPYASFCGATEEPLEIPADTELHFWIGSSAYHLVGWDNWQSCLPGSGTTGTVRATFSNLP